MSPAFDALHRDALHRDDLHRDALRTLTSWSAPNTSQAELRAQFLAYLSGHADAVRRASTPAHLTASGFVLDARRERMALVLHRKVGRWLQPGGHCEDSDSTLAEAAVREATEETGLAGLRLVGEGPIDLDRHPAPCRPGSGDWHFDVRYLLVAPPQAQLAVSEESLDVRWFPLGELPDPPDPSLTRVAANVSA